jgi:hypothetical protein
MFKGVHFRKVDQILFDTLTARFTGLDRWMNVHGFEFHDDFAKGIHGVTCTRPPSLTIAIDNAHEIVVESVVLPSTRSIHQTHATITQEWRVQFASKKPERFEAFWTQLWNLQSFLAFALQEAVFPTSLQGRKSTSEGSSQDKSGYVEPIEIFLKPLQTDPETDGNGRGLPLFRQDEVPDIGLVIRNWTAKKEVLWPLQYLFFVHPYIEKHLLSAKFMDNVRALEVYHRLAHPCGPEEIARYHEISKQILKSSAEIISRMPGYEERIRSKLDYAYEPTLRQRLRTLVSQVNPVMKWGHNGDSEKWVSKVVDTRNYLTHYDARLRKVAAQGLQLQRISGRSESLIIALLLLELGLGEDLAEKIIQRRRQYLAYS